MNERTASAFYTCPHCAIKYWALDRFIEHLAQAHGRDIHDNSVSLPTAREHEQTSLEETRAELERATTELDELRTTLERQSTAKAASDAAANRMRATIWAALEAGTLAEMRRVLREGVE